MKTKLNIVALFVIAASLAAGSDSFRSHGCGVMWYGKITNIRFVDDTFKGSPSWNPSESKEPSLTQTRACQIANEYVRATKADQLTYRIESVDLKRYYDTDWWYYRIGFRAAIPEGDLSWQQTEPYRTLLAQGLYPHSTNSAPRLGVAILLSGEIVEPEK